jgi:hypothetical protein
VAALDASQVAVDSRVVTGWLVHGRLGLGWIIRVQVFGSARFRI